MLERQFSRAMREVAANMLRIVRGAGKPEALLVQMKFAIDLAIAFHQGQNYWPVHIIARELELTSEAEFFLNGAREGRLTQSDIDRWSKDGTFHRMQAEYVIFRGALQTIASGLLARISHRANCSATDDRSIWRRQRGAVALKAR
ncbi:hypothetical protein, partial [Bradyrhizobium zhanjiangense]|uniref:hypothetical protein n=1 Tax=Bradyrhizobium zhanjiangense TaxID=1325107 RepID=UPI0019D6C69F